MKYLLREGLLWTQMEMRVGHVRVADCDHCHKGVEVMRAILTLLLLVPSLAYALSPTAGTSITLYGGENLSVTGAATLRGLLIAMPTSLYPHLAVITVDGAPIPAERMIETCDQNQYMGPCRTNIYSGGEHVMEDPFPVDAPRHVAASSFYSVAAHELGHQVSYWARFHRQGNVATGWDFNLTRESGCEQRNYLRSMLPSCYFYDNSQEFTASLINQWATCSECTLALALKRGDDVIVHPLNQIVFLLWLFGSRPAGPAGQLLGGSVLSYRVSESLPVVTPWTVRPWRCGGDVTIVGPTFALTLTLDNGCRVTAVGEREGI